MEKLLKLINLEALKGSRTKIALVVWASLRALVAVGIVPTVVLGLVEAIGFPVLLYFVLEHFEKK